MEVMVTKADGGYIVRNPSITKVCVSEEEMLTLVKELLNYDPRFDKVTPMQYPAVALP